MQCFPFWTGKKPPIARLPEVQFLPPPTFEELSTPLRCYCLKGEIPAYDSPANVAIRWEDVIQLIVYITMNNCIGQVVY